MIPGEPEANSKNQPAVFPRRDWVLLPLIALSTIIFIAGGTEFFARKAFFKVENGLTSCFEPYDSAKGTRAVPNSTCWEKRPEAKLPARYDFNSCGHRAGEECGPKPKGEYRVVMTGSSFVMGSGVPRELTFGALLPGKLSKVTGAKVDVYNEGMGLGFPPRSVDLYFGDVLKVQPDAILWLLTPADVMANPPVTKKTATAHAGFVRRAWMKASADLKTKSVASTIRDFWSDTRSSVLMEHLIDGNRNHYVQSYLRGQSAEFLFAKPKPDWQRQLDQLDVYAGDIASKAHAANVPLFVTFLPNRPQAAMISMNSWPSGYDPYEIGEEIRRMALHNGATYVDVLHDFAQARAPEEGYLLVDGHPNSYGHAMIADFLASEIARGGLLQLAGAESKNPVEGR